LSSQKTWKQLPLRPYEVMGSSCPTFRTMSNFALLGGKETTTDLCDDAVPSPLHLVTCSLGDIFSLGSETPGYWRDTGAWHRSQLAGLTISFP
jgi:hypothetical protein